MPVGQASLAYLYDNSFEGLLTAVFESYARREMPCLIAPEEDYQASLEQKAVEIITDPVKALRVEKGIIRKAGVRAYETVATAFLSDEWDKSTKIYRYIRKAMSDGSRIYIDLAHDDVLAINQLMRNLNMEAHLHREFLRFAVMANGVSYARITPKHNVIPLIMPHFCDRYSIMPFLIHDPVHKLAGLFDTKQWYLVETECLTMPEPAEDEREYQRMWKSFYDTIAIPERVNPRCRRTHMPMRFWRNMTEMTFMEEARANKKRESGSSPLQTMPRALRQQNTDS